MKSMLTCCICGKPFTESASHVKRRVTCSVKCRIAYSKRFEVTADNLLIAVWERSTLRIAELFGVSDKAIEKRCKKLGVIKPPRGYWAMLEQGGATHAAALQKLGWDAKQIHALDRRLANARSRII